MPAMHTIDLAYVGRGIHEELIAYVADQEGYFEDEGVHVAVRDGIRWKTERLRGGATIGLGRTLLSRLNDGIPWTMLAVNTHRPLFWFVGRGDVKSMEDLRRHRLAVHAPRTAPGCFARIVLRKHGLDPDRDVQCIARARRLSNGSAAPARRFDRCGLRGQHAIARTGRRRRGLFGTVLGRRPLPDSHRGNRRGPHSRPARQSGFASGGASQPAPPANDRRKTPVGDRLHRLVPQPTDTRRSSALLRALHRPDFSADGQVDLNVAQQAVNAVATGLGVATASADQIYHSATAAAT